MIALRVARGFRTVSYEPIGIISLITPPNIMVMELKRIDYRVRIIGRTLTTEERREESQKSLNEWHITYDTKTYRQCTKLV